VKPNWPFPLWVAGALWAARRSGPSLLRWNALASAVVHALVLVELFAYPVRLGDDTWVGWRSLREQTRARLAPGEFAFSADDYKTTAELLLDGRVEAYGRNLLGQPALQFDLVGLDAGRSRDAPACSSTRTAAGSTMGPPDRRRRRSFGAATGDRGATAAGPARRAHRPALPRLALRGLPAAAGELDPGSRRGCSATRPGRVRVDASLRTSRQSPPSIAVCTSEASSPPRSPARRSPRMRSVCACTTARSTPRSRRLDARATDVIGSRATRIGSPRAGPRPRSGPPDRAAGSVKRV
jgi:hypothetical protein